MPASPSDTELLAGLNPVQREAVVHDEGPLLVIAGAGSGKTRVLTSRIAHLIRTGVSPFEILAITFTNKAAQEMKQRVGALVGPVAEKMWVSTFHSACVRILRRDGHRLGYPSSFTIYDQADAVRLTGYVIRDKGLDAKRFPPRSVHATISAAKNDDVGPEAYAARAQVIFERKIADVYASIWDNPESRDGYKNVTVEQLIAHTSGMPYAPKNDDNDPYNPVFEEKDFEYCKHTVEIANLRRTPRQRRPKVAPPRRYHQIPPAVLWA